MKSDWLALLLTAGPIWLIIGILIYWLFKNK